MTLAVAGALNPKSTNQHRGVLKTQYHNHKAILFPCFLANVLGILPIPLHIEIEAIRF